MPEPRSASYSTPLPVRWSADRDDRGASPSRRPRCTTRGCPVVFASGPDRPCRWHADEAAAAGYAGLGQPGEDDDDGDA